MSEEKFDELNKNGLKSINVAKRKENKEEKTEPVSSSVKGMFGEAGEEKVSTESTLQKNDMLAISKTDLQKMIADAVQSATTELKQEKDRLVQEKVGEWKPYKAPKELKRTAKMKLYREDSDAPFGLVVDWKHFKYEYDENTRRHNKDIYKITVKYEEGEKEYFMPLLDFSHLNDFETVEIVSQERRQLVKDHGSIAVTSKDKGYSLYRIGTDGWQAVKESFTVPLNEIKDEVIAVIKRADGSTMKINVNRLNP